jgi:hypothetical protein
MKEPLIPREDRLLFIILIGSLIGLVLVTIGAYAYINDVPFMELLK